MVCQRHNWRWIQSHTNSHSIRTVCVGRLRRAPGGGCHHYRRHHLAVAFNLDRDRYHSVDPGFLACSRLPGQEKYSLCCWPCRGTGCIPNWCPGKAGQSWRRPHLPVHSDRIHPSSCSLHRQRDYHIDYSRPARYYV